VDECYIEQAYIELQIEQITLKNFENRFHFENQITKTSQVFLLFGQFPYHNLDSYIFVDFSL
jgi:hypothetical protein